MTRRVVVIQARVSSTRMPGKVLADLGGLPMIAFMVRRVRRAQRVDAVVVATSTDPSDDPLAAALARHGIDCFRGSLDDVLDRYYQTARAARADHVVRLTGDCPLIDADLVDEALAELERGNWDYVGNLDPPTYPDGLSVEAFTMRALEAAWREARLASEREHVTPWLRKPENGMRRENLRAEPDRSALRWTVDYPDDLEHVRELVAAMFGKPDFDRNDLYHAIEARGLARRVEHARGEGYAKSLAADRVVRPGGG